MWVESLELENIRCFESASLRFVRKAEDPYKWVTFLGENGCGKSTALLALGLLLAGPEGAQSLLPRPLGWLRDESKQGKISAQIHQDDDDPGQFGSEKIRRAYGFSFWLTGTKPLTVNNRLYTEPSIVPGRAENTDVVAGECFSLGKIRLVRCWLWRLSTAYALQPGDRPLLANAGTVYQFLDAIRRG